MPKPTDSAPCGSKSTSSTRRPTSASAAPRLMVVVVLPTPPFWLHIAMTRAGPCEASGGGTGKSGSGRPTVSSTGAPWPRAGPVEAWLVTADNLPQPLGLTARMPTPEHAPPPSAEGASAQRPWVRGGVDLAQRVRRHEG